MQTIVETVNRPDNEVDVIEPVDEGDHSENTDDIHEVYIMNPKHEDRSSSFFAQPGVLAGESTFSCFFFQLFSGKTKPYHICIQVLKNHIKISIRNVVFLYSNLKTNMNYRF